MGRLKAELEKQFSLIPKDDRPLVFNPKNCVEVRFEVVKKKKTIFAFRHTARAKTPRVWGNAFKFLRQRAGLQYHGLIAGV